MTEIGDRDNESAKADMIDIMLQRRRSKLGESSDLDGSHDQLRSELANLPYEEVENQYNKSFRIDSDEGEAKRFDNRKNREADFEHWAKIDLWTIEEAVSLSFGKNPEIVNLEILEGELSRHGPSPFIQKFRKLSALASRAVSAKKMNEMVEPNAYIVWAKRKNIDLPERLIQEVKKYHKDLVTGGNLNGSKELRADTKVNYLKMILGLAIHAGYDPDTKKKSGLTGDKKGSFSDICKVPVATVRRILTDAKKTVGAEFKDHGTRDGDK